MSLAGITMNLILFVAGCVVMYVLVGVALSRAAANTSNDAYFLEQYGGQLCYFMKGVDYTYLPVSSVLTYAPYLSDYLIAPVFGEVAKYLYEMLMYFTITNLILAVFNLIPVPPLDGYHVLNDLILRKRNLFVSPRVSQVFMVILFVLMFSGYTDFIFEGAADGPFRRGPGGGGCVLRRGDFVAWRIPCRSSSSTGRWTCF